MRRLIPACAGKTDMVRGDSVWCEAHPRVCGENSRFCFLLLRLRGSSPRVRGKRGFLFRCLLRGGLIPACAGKTFFVWYSRARARAHPRVCGENQIRFYRLWTR